MVDNFTIVDGHVHTFPTDEVASKIIKSFNKVYDIEFKNPGTGSIANVLENMEQNRIDYTVMANFAPAKILNTNNLWAIDIAKEYTNLIALVSFHPDMEGCLRQLLESYISGGARGIKIHPMAQEFDPAHKRLDDVYSYCNETNFPIVFHCGRVSNARLNEYADLDMILPVVEKYPNIPFVLTHMADGNIEDVIKLSKNYENIFFDTSIVITGFPPIMNVNEPSWLDDNIVKGIIDEVGAKRVIFGSDFPWGSPKHDIDRIKGINLSDEQKRLILGKNALKLFKI